MQNRAKRNILRHSWANPTLLHHFLPSGYKSKLVFILGLPTDQSQQSAIDYESEVYKDILQVGFVDHYRNNTYKAIYNMK